MQLEMFYVSLDQLSGQEYHTKYQRNLKIVICIYLPDFSESWQVEICGIFRKRLRKIRTLASGQTFCVWNSW